MRCNTPMMLCAEKNLSATIPTKNGEMIVAMASAPYAAPIWVPFAPRYVPMYVPSVTYHDPQMKYSRSIIVESCARTVDLIEELVLVRTKLAKRRLDGLPPEKLF